MVPSSTCFSFKFYHDAKNFTALVGIIDLIHFSATYYFLAELSYMSHYESQCYTEVSCWNSEVILYTELPSFQGVGIERFHYTEVSSWNRGVPLYTKVSSLQGIGFH